MEDPGVDWRIHCHRVNNNNTNNNYYYYYYYYIKMDHQEVGCGGIDWIELAQDRDRWRALVYTIKNLR
jgi:hypothetical protein